MLWHIVRAYPAVYDGAGRYLPGRRPETFAALGDLDDIEADHLKKDHRYADPAGHLFFSRAWAGTVRPHQPGTVKFDYPLVAVQPFDYNLQFGRGKQDNHLRISLVAMGQMADQNDHRTVEEVEADLTTIWESVVRELIDGWAAYETPDGLMWSPVPIPGRAVWKMKNALVEDAVQGTFYRDVGIDRVSGVQGFLTLRMPSFRCYRPQGGAAFDYGIIDTSPVRPDGLPGGGEEAETATT